MGSEFLHRYDALATLSRNPPGFHNRTCRSCVISIMHGGETMLSLLMFHPLIKWGVLDRYQSWRMMPALASIQVPQAVKQLDKDYRLETSENERLAPVFIKSVASAEAANIWTELEHIVDSLRLNSCLLTWKYSVMANGKCDVVDRGFEVDLLALK